MQFREDTTRRTQARVDITPLIDVVFQLLIFFMLSATFVVQSSINIEMPKAEGATTLEVKDISITLAYDPANPEGGNIFLNSEAVGDIEELSRRLAEVRDMKPDVLVLIRPDRRIAAGRLIEIMGVTRSLGISRCFVAALPPEEE
jgi:biopolymer transport protein ExbD